MYSFTQVSIASKNARSELDLPGISLVYKYLADRGIDREDIEALSLHITSASQLVSLIKGRPSSDERLAVIFPHYNISGELMDWWSARLVDTGLQVVHKGFNAMVERQARGKMFCPPQEPPSAYLPPTIPWSKLQDGDKVYIHESCVKAVNGAKLRYYSVGLNGVWGWTSQKHGIRLVPELRDLPWKMKHLKPVIVFDSNAEDNWNVKKAIIKLAQTLHEICGTEATHILLPRAADGSHQGFDDFCQNNPLDVVEEFLQQDGMPIEHSKIEALKAELNSEVCVVKSLNRVAVQDTGTLMTFSAFTQITYAHYVALTDDETPKPVNVPKLWLQDSRRSAVESLAYLPGQPKIHNGMLNLWRGMGQDPTNGEIQPFLDLVQNCVRDPALLKWMLQWFAYPLQNLGAKLTTFLHVFGPAGTGKNMMLRPFLHIYGSDNSITIGRENISGDFNSIFAARQFVNIDEIHGSAQDALAIYNKIKKIITGEEIVVNRKGDPEYKIKNCINLVTTSNYYDSIKLDSDDRRAAVIKFDPIEDKRHDQDYWLRYVHWCDHEGAAALYHYLLRLDMEGFDPSGWAPASEYKEDVIEASRTHLESWCNDLKLNPSDILPIIHEGRALFTAKELAVYAFADGDVSPGRIMSLAKMLTNAGFKKANGGKGIKTPDGRVDRYWIVRGRDIDWSEAWKCSEHIRLFLKS